MGRPPTTYHDLIRRDQLVASYMRVNDAAKLLLDIMSHAPQGMIDPETTKILVSADRHLRKLSEVISGELRIRFDGSMPG